MANFKYTIKDEAGKTLKGVVQAESKDNAIQSLRAKGMIILSLDEEKGFKLSFGGGKTQRKKKVKIDDLVVFSRQLATMVNAGIPLVNGLDILGDQIEKPSFKETILKVHDDVETGSSLSEAISRHPHIFSDLFINMIKAGETSGMLDEIMDRLAIYLEKTSSLQKKIKAALVYPIAVTIMAIGITIFLMIRVIPVFKDIYEGFDASLPAPTAALLAVSDFMRQYFYVAIALLCLGWFLFKRYARTEKGKLRIDKLKLRMPIFGTLMSKMAVGKFTRTLSTLVRSGVPILGALEIVSKTSGNRVVETAVDKVRENVREGEPIADPLSRSGVFPSMVVRMISVGEQTGELEKMLTKIADFYEEQVDAAVSGLTSLIESLIIAFLGIVIGGIVICMFLPILNISTALGG